MSDYDFVIVGAGSAGCVVANRLSADPARRVLLLEAGPVFAPDRYPAELLDADIITRTGKYTWGLKSDRSDYAPAYDVAAGKVGGGGSTVNAANIRRPRRDDIDRWNMPGWSWDEVIRTYKSIEDSSEADSIVHHRGGPLPVNQLRRVGATPALNAFVDSCVATGRRRIEDANAGDHDGVTLEVRNVVEGKRINTAIAYLPREVRARPNLTIRDATEVDHVLLDGTRATGVILADGSSVTAGEVVLSAGVYHSPGLLMRSGIGPETHLAEYGIETVVDLPVGEGLRDHPTLFTTYALRREIEDVRPAAAAVLATTSDESEGGELDLWTFCYNFRMPLLLGGRPMLMVGAAVMRPLSRGHVRLSGRQISDKPEINHNLLNHPSDRRRLLDAIRLSRRVLKASPLVEIIDDRKNDAEEVNDDTLFSEVKRGLGTFDHGHCTARMGAHDDRTAVVDSVGRVHGVNGLRVIDASIFPDTLSVPLNLTVIMVAERIAAAMTA